MHQFWSLFGLLKRFNKTKSDAKMQNGGRVANGWGCRMPVVLVLLAVGAVFAVALAVGAVFAAGLAVGAVFAAGVALEVGDVQVC